MMTGNSTAVAKKILEVMKRIDGIAKDKRNEFHKYDYVSDEAIVTAIRKAMIEVGLVAIPNQHDYKRDGDIVTLAVGYTLIDVETGEGLNTTAYGEGKDSGDKAVYKAATGAEKYFFLKTFLIPTGDDPEKETAASKAKSQPKKQKANEAVEGKSKIQISELKDDVTSQGKVFYRLVDMGAVPYKIWDKDVWEFLEYQKQMPGKRDITIKWTKDKWGYVIHNAYCNGEYAKPPKGEDNGSDVDSDTEELAGTPG